jgi:hypothetical protein
MKIRFKNCWLALSAFFAMTVLLEGQMVLYPGAVYTYEFSTLPFAGNVPVANATGGCFLEIHAEQTGDFLFEMFSDSPTGTPFASSTLSANLWGPNFDFFPAGNGWGDLTGSVRFTGLSGVAVIDTFQIDASIPHDAFSADTYGLNIVPEPPLLTMVSAGTNVVVIWPTNYTSVTLQSTTDLASPVWTTNLPAPVVVNGHYAVTNPISGTQQFFRLSQ